MNKKVLAILDSEERYAYGLMEYFEEKSSLPFRIHVFTSMSRFVSFSNKEEIECVMVSEKDYDRTIEQFSIPHIIILSESGKEINPTLHHVDKFQACENIYREVIRYYSEHQDGTLSVMRNNKNRLKIIGIYTPIGRCLQTTFAFTLGQVLSKEAKVLYLNFERYSGLSGMLRRQFSTDISDLIYYFECAKEKLSYRIDSIVESVNGLDFIPPASIYQNLAGIKGDQWIELFLEMEKCTEYEYLILDLTDGMLDLWSVLRFCDVIYTISKDDPIALSKIEQYEKAIETSDFSEILSKTRKYNFPVFLNLPYNFDELTRGDLYRYICKNIIPDIHSIGEEV